MWLYAPNLSSVHGFSDRHGGVSRPPFDSLNLGGSDDDPADIAKNRELALQKLGLGTNALCFLKQVHGADVLPAKPGRMEGDGLVTREPGLVLAVSVADCYPVLLEDPVNKVIGAVHAGWRGTCAGIAGNAVREMRELGADPAGIRVAIGQGICAERFEVGEEVISEFRGKGFPEKYLRGRHIDLPSCLVYSLCGEGVRRENIWTMNRCTFEPDFYSHRRDTGRTGRMWGLICMNQ